MDETNVQPDITISDLEGLCESIALARSALDEASAVKKEKDAAVDELEGKLRETLNALGKKNYDSRVGLFSISHRTSVKVPSTPEAKQELFEYLRGKGVFDSLVSVNSQTLNAFYREELELAKQEGKGMEFSIPGIGEPTINEIISFKKAK